MVSMGLPVLLCSAAWGVSFDGQRVSKTDPGSGCSDPPAATAFLTTDAAVYLYYYATTTLSDHITSDWLAPDGAVLAGGDWGNPVSGRYCYTGERLGSLSQIPISRLGAWQSRVYANGTLLFSVPFTINSAGPVITTTSLPNGTQGTQYNQPLTAAGGTPPYAWSATGLPGGLSLNAGTGVLSGTPSASGNFNVTVKVTDSSSPALTYTTSPPLPLTVNAPAGPVISSVGGVVNGASFRSGLASGTWITIFGTNLSATTRQWQGSDFVGNNLPTALDNVRVTINGRAAYIYYISPTQVNALAPDDPTTGPVPVQLINAAGSSNIVTATKQAVAPALFAYSQGSGRYAIGQDGSTYAFIGPAGLLGSGAATKPATPGEIMVLYATGLGATNPAYPAGQIIQSPILLASSLQVLIGGFPATIQFAGITGAGLYQLNVVVPSLPTGDASIVLNVGGAQSPSQVFIPIQGSGTQVTLSTSYTYDAASRIASITYPSGWKAVYARDTMGRITAVTAQAPGAAAPVPIASNVAYEPFGPVTGLKYGNGIAETRSFDLDYRLTGIVSTGNKPVQNLVYGYDSADNVLSVADAITSGNTQRLGYDTLDRLTSAAGAYGSLGYTYDPVGNRLTQTLGADTTTYSYAAHSNRLSTTASGGTTQTLGYTAAGNINSFSPGVPPPNGAAPLTSLVYNQSGRLVAMAAGGNTVAQYSYDAFGQRLVKAEPATSTTTLYQYDQRGRLLEESNNQGNPAASDYIYLDDGRPIATLTPVAGNVYFLHDDRLGTPQAATDANQAIAWSATYQPFGQTTNVQSSLVEPQNLRLPGQEFDADSGFYHNGFRDYVPNLGRYLQSDPVGLAAGVNSYGYAGQSPTNRIDPTGRWAVIDDLVFTGGGALIGAASSAIADVATGNVQHFWEDVTAGTVGGAVAGETTLYLGPIAGGLAGGVSSNLVDAGWDLANGTFGKTSLSNRLLQTAFDSAFGALVGSAFVGAGPSISGITSGSNSFASIGESIATEFANGTISDLSISTALKWFVGTSIQDAALEGATLSDIVSNRFHNALTGCF